MSCYRKCLSIGAKCTYFNVCGEKCLYSNETGYSFTDNIRICPDCEAKVPSDAVRCSCKKEDRS